MAPDDQVMVFEGDYPGMKLFALAWFLMIRACGDAGMTDKELTSKGSLLSFPGSVTVPSTRPYPLGLDASSDLRLDGFLLKRSGMGPLATVKKCWCMLQGTKLLVCSDWVRLYSMTQSHPTVLESLPRPE